MSDSDGSPQRVDRDHLRSSSRSPVSPEGAGETPAEREERWLAEAAVLVGPLAGQPRGAFADTGPSTQEPELAKVTALAAQTASPRRPGSRDRRPSEPRRGPDRGPRHAADTGGSPGAGTRRIAEGCTSRRGERGGCTRGCNRGLNEPRHPLDRPRRCPQPAAKAGDRPRTGHRCLAGGRRSSSSGEGGREVPRPRQPHPHPYQPPKPFPPKPFPPGRTRHVRPPAPERSPPGVTLPQLQRQRDARRVIEEGGDGAQAELRASHGSAARRTGGDRGSAQGHAQGAGQGTRGKEQGRKHGRGTEASSSGGGQSAGSGRGREPGRGRGTGRARRGAGRAPRCMERSEGRWASRQARAWVTGGGTHGTGRGTEAWGPEGGPRARARAPQAPNRRDGAWEPGGEGGPKRGGRGAGHPRSRTCSR